MGSSEANTAEGQNLKKRLKSAAKYERLAHGGEG
jgi:hypothetical protein